MSRTKNQYYKATADNWRKAETWPTTNILLLNIRFILFVYNVENAKKLFRFLTIYDHKNYAEIVDGELFFKFCVRSCKDFTEERKL